MFMYLLYKNEVRYITHIGLHLSTHAEKETRYIQYGPLLLYLILRGRIYNSIAGGIVVQMYMSSAPGVEDMKFYPCSSRIRFLHAQ